VNVAGIRCGFKPVTKRKTTIDSICFISQTAQWFKCSFYILCR